VNKIKTNKKVKNVRAKLFTAFGIMVLILAVPLTALAEDAGDPASSPGESTQTADSTGTESSSSETGSTGSAEPGVSDDSATGSDSDTTAADDSESSTDSTPPPSDEAPASEDSDNNPADQDSGDNPPEPQATDDSEDPVTGESGFTPSYFEVQQVSMSPLLNPGNIIELVSKDYAEGDQLVPLGAGVSYSTSEATILGKAEPSALTTAELEAGGLGWSSVLALTAQTPAGDGTESNPYLIDSLANLYWITTSDEVEDHNDESITQANRWTKHYLQTAEDIDLNVAPFNIGEGWSPIGNSTNLFNGSYNGDGKTISNLFINRSENYIGLFGNVGSSAQIKNIALEDIDVTKSAPQYKRLCCGSSHKALRPDRVQSKSVKA
jgi:hypothetical protein